MLTIQEVGTEILENRPRKFYAMIGKEYGIKMKYVDIMSQNYGQPPVEASSVSDVLAMMSTKHLIPLLPKVYLVRYDEMFISDLDEKMSEKIKRTKIVGTIVCIYESEKSSTKLLKYLPNDTVSVDEVSKRFMVSYLHKDFPNLPDRLIDVSADMSSDYNQARNICRCMLMSDIEKLYTMTDSELFSVFGVQISADDDVLKKYVASRDFAACLHVYDVYNGTDDEFLYTILSTMIELEKIVTNKFVESKLREYSNMWNLKDIYNMFMNTYQEIINIRTYSQLSTNSAVYLLSFLQFSEIPSMEYMQS